MKNVALITALLGLSAGGMLMAQGPGGAGGAKGGAKGPPRPVFYVTTDAFPDGGVIPMKNAGTGENKSPAFEFHWNLGPNPGAAPDTLQTYAVVFHDMENSSNKTSVDTLHWSAFNIPGSAKGLPEALGKGDLPDGTRNGPGIANRGGNPGAFFGPGAPAGPAHHYVFEFYALDAKLDLPATASRDELIKAIDGHVIGKAVWFGRFPGPRE